MSLLSVNIMSVDNNALMLNLGYWEEYKLYVPVFARDYFPTNVHS
jgi:hypothetical protein